MKYLRYALLAIVLLLCVTVALANHDPVTLALWPDTVTAFVGFGYTITLPLFLIVGGAAGLVWGQTAPEALVERERTPMSSSASCGSRCTSAMRSCVRRYG